MPNRSDLSVPWRRRHTRSGRYTACIYAISIAAFALIGLMVVLGYVAGFVVTELLELSAALPRP